MINLNKDIGETQTNSNTNLVSIQETVKESKSNNNYFKSIPEDCSILAFTFLQFNEIAKINATCKNFNSITSNPQFYEALFDRISLGRLEYDTSGEGKKLLLKINIKKANSLTNIFSFKTKNLRIILSTETYELEKKIPKFVNLESLEVGRICPYVPDNSILLGNISQLTHISSLDISFMLLKDTDLNPISKLVKLTYLNLDGNEKLTTQGILQLRRIKKLSHLLLYGCTKIDAQGIDYLSKTMKLKTLGLSRAENISDDGMKSLSTMTSLTELDLEHCNSFGDLGFSFLTRLSNLTVLHFGLYELFSEQNVTNEGLMGLSELRNLKSLSLFGRPLSDTGIQSISKLKSLTYLDISYCKLISDEGMKCLSNLKSLTFLDISLCQLITDKGIYHVSQLKNLTELKADSLPNITDEAFVSLSKLPNLTSLTLNHKSLRELLKKSDAKISKEAILK